MASAGAVDVTAQDGGFGCGARPKRPKRKKPRIGAGPKSPIPSLGSVAGPVPPTLPCQPELVAKPSRCGNGKQAQPAPYKGVDGPEGGHGASVIGALMMVICPNPPPPHASRPRRKSASSRCVSRRKHHRPPQRQRLGHRCQRIGATARSTHDPPITMFDRDWTAPRPPPP